MIIFVSAQKKGNVGGTRRLPIGQGISQKQTFIRLDLGKAQNFLHRPPLGGGSTPNTLKGFSEIEGLHDSLDFFLGSGGHQVEGLPKGVSRQDLFGPGNPGRLQHFPENGLGEMKAKLPDGIPVSRQSRPSEVKRNFLKSGHSPVGFVVAFDFLPEVFRVAGEKSGEGLPFDIQGLFDDPVEVPNQDLGRQELSGSRQIVRFSWGESVPGLPVVLVRTNRAGAP